MRQQTSPPERDAAAPGGDAVEGRAGANASAGTVAGAAAPRMAVHFYDLLPTVSDTRYWRAAGRNELLHSLWRDHRQPAASGGAYRVLDVGCGPGGLLAYLRDHEVQPLRPFGVDVFVETLRYCVRRGLCGVAAADATRLPFPDGSFDLVVSQDVMEHVPDDGGMAAEACRVCAPGGLVLLLVPAGRGLWSTRDVRLGHCRRYTLRELEDRVRAAGLRPLRRTHADMLLLPPLWVMLKLAKKTPQGVPDVTFDAPGGRGMVNAALKVLARTEAYLARRLRLPFGVSAVVLARKPEARVGAP